MRITPGGTPHRAEAANGRSVGGLPRGMPTGNSSRAGSNLASMLLREPGVQAWSIEPLVSRSLQHPGVVTTFELDRDGHVEIGELDHDRVKLDAVPDGLLRPVRDVEPRYTLERAREILAGCTRHEWTVQLDGDGHPVGVRCASPHCEEQRPLAT